MAAGQGRDLLARTLDRWEVTTNSFYTEKKCRRQDMGQEYKENFSNGESVAKVEQ
jgi:hypothetical protein